MLVSFSWFALALCPPAASLPTPTPRLCVKAQAAGHGRATDWSWHQMNWEQGGGGGLGGWGVGGYVQEISGFVIDIVVVVFFLLGLSFTGSLCHHHGRKAQATGLQSHCSASPDTLIVFWKRRRETLDEVCTFYKPTQHWGWHPLVYLNPDLTVHLFFVVFFFNLLST